MSDKEQILHMSIAEIAAKIAGIRNLPDVGHVEKNIRTVVGSLSEEYQYNPDVTLPLIKKAIARYQKDYGVNLRPLFTNPELRTLLDSAE